jgi:hypothetical protein
MYYVGCSEAREERARKKNKRKNKKEATPFLVSFRLLSRQELKGDPNWADFDDFFLT